MALKNCQGVPIGCPGALDIHVDGGRAAKESPGSDAYMKPAFASTVSI